MLFRFGRFVFALSAGTPSFFSPKCQHPDSCLQSLGLSKTSDQAYIEFESIEAIVKTASRTKFFIEFYSTCLEGQRGPLLAVGHESVGCQRLPRVVSPSHALPLNPRVQEELRE